jgi:hypothetical protein
LASAAGQQPFHSLSGNPATVASVTLSGGNLVATNTGTTSTNQGAHVDAGSGKTSGKYYFEITMTTVSGGGGNLGIGLGTTASTYSGMGGNATTGDMLFVAGSLWANGSSLGLALGARINGNVIGVAVDLDNRKIWFKSVGSSPTVWNASSGGSNDPATNVGGITIPAGTMAPFCTFGGGGGVASQVFTANFGVAAFTGTVPSGFTSGWTM